MSATLITGGAGFIGSNFVETLFEKLPDEKILVLDVFTYAAHPDNIPEHVRDSTRFKLVRGDIRDRDLVRQLVGQVDKVVHFAAESHVTRSIADDLPFFETDVMGTQSVADAISRNAGRIKRFVHISTSEVYGTAESAPMDETHPLNPCTPYAAAKAGADRLVYAYGKTYDIPMVIIRPFNNYGPRQHLEKVIPRFISSALNDKPLTVHGDGRMTRDWIFVKDTCQAVYNALMTPGIDGNIVNIGTGVDTPVLDIAKMILDATGKSHSLIEYVDQRPGQVDRHISSVTKAARLFGGWVPPTYLTSGIEQTVKWYADNRAWWERLCGAEVVDVTDPARRITGAY